MAFVGSLFSKKNGAGFQAQGTPLLNTASEQQANELYNQGQKGIEFQRNFMGALQQQANGGGPNPALAQLAQSTGNNIAGTAALMAGQRGASANPGLLARQIGMQGGNLQQQAAGQAATLQAQQQLAAQNALGSAIGGYNQTVQGMQGNVLGAAGNLNSARVGMQSNINNANAGIAGENAKTQGGMLNGLGGLGAAMLLNQGGAVPDPYNCGGMVAKGSGPKSHITAHMMKSGGQVPGRAQVAGNSVKNDTVPAVLSPGEVVIPRSVMSAKDPPKAAAEFVRQVMSQKRKKK